MSTSPRALCRLALLALAAPLCAQSLPGEVEKELKLDAFSPGLLGELDAGDRFGRAVSTVRDLDNDGVGDIVVGCPWDDDGGPERGAAWILFLDAQGGIRDTTKISSTQGGFLGALADDNHFGNAVAYLGDLDGNGRGEIAVSSFKDDDGGEDAGAVWILFLNADGTIDRHQKISPLFGKFHFELDAGDRFGRSVAGLSDVDGDGVPDLAIGAIGDDDGGTDAGAVYVCLMKPDGDVRKMIKISEQVGGFTGPLQAQDRFGQACAGFNDHDHDGTPDLLVGAWFDDTGGPEQGAFWELSLKPDGTVKSQLKVGENLGGFSGHLDPGDRFGGALATLGDLDGDAVDDIVVGSLRDDDGGVDTGAVWVLFLDDDGSVKSHQKISPLEGGFGGPLADEDDFGAVAAIQDLNADGTVDLGVGAFGDDGLGDFTGAVWILQMHAVHWYDLGHALAGANGEPRLQGLGSLLPKTEVKLLLSKAAPLQMAWLFVGASPIEAQLLGGVLVPAPDAKVGPEKINALGAAQFDGRWPPDAPSGSTLWFQAWIPDAGAPQGWAASNALQVISP
jgi:hypothetical protein